MVDFLLPDRTDESLDKLLERQAKARRAMPFDEASMNFVGSLSKTLLADRSFRDFPELMAMAHWFRPAKLRDLRQTLISSDDPTTTTRHIFLPRGLVFHIAPSNVDSVFIYSWLLSLLCGNPNIARVSRSLTLQMQAFFAATAKLLGDKANRDLAESNVVCSYDHDSAITEQLSERCQLRVIWGGDNTIREIRAIPLPPLSSELAFANRFSLAVISARTVLALNGEELNSVTRDFYNDAFWFNQQACSSPRAVIWIGDNVSIRKARDVFWRDLEKHLQIQRPENQPGHVMDRTTTMFQLAYSHTQSRALSPAGALPSRILVDELSLEDRDCHDGNGLFIELERPKLSDITTILNSGDQTIAHLGFERHEWLALLPELPPHAADRIVPIGQALAFDPVWTELIYSERLRERFILVAIETIIGNST